MATVERPQIRRFTVEEYYQMGAVGIFAAERVELIDGEIVMMCPIGSRHASCVRRLNRLFQTLGARAIVDTQHPVRLGERSEPEPDLTLLRPRPDDYAASHPTPADVLLLVEVMDTSAPFDRGTKLPLYARAGIGEVWLIDFNRECIEVHRRPVEGGYAEKTTRTRGQSVAPEAFPDCELTVDSILGDEGNR